LANSKVFIKELGKAATYYLSYDPFPKLIISLNDNSNVLKDKEN
jgi:hypothetical protein